MEVLSSSTSRGASLSQDSRSNSLPAQNDMANTTGPSTDPAPFDYICLISLLKTLGAGPEVVDHAIEQHARTSMTQDGHGLVVSPQHEALLQRNFAYDVLLSLFVPFRAISVAAGEVPVEADSDSDGSFSDFGAGSDVDDRGPPSHVAKRPQRPPPSNDDPILTYIFPPSPLARLARPPADDNDDDDAAPPSAVHAARCLALLDPEAVALLQRTAHDRANTVTLRRAWSRAFLRFAAVIEPGDDGSDGNMVIRSVADATATPAVVHIDADNPPSRALLALHAKMALVLHETRANTYIDALLADNAECEDLAWDGASVHVGVLMQLRLDGWCPGKGRRRQHRHGPVGLDGVGIWIERAQLVDEERNDLRKYE